MSVDVKVEKFDVNSGLEASVIIDGDVFTINIDSDSVQKVLAENTLKLTQANLDKISDREDTNSIKSKSSVSSVIIVPNSEYMKKRDQLELDLTGLSDDEFNEKYDGTVRNTNRDAAGGGEEIVYGYEQATLDEFNGKSKEIKKEINEIYDSDSSDSEIKKANEHFEKEFGKYKDEASKTFLKSDKNKINFVGYHRANIDKLLEMKKKVENDNTAYGLQFKKNIQNALNVTEEDIESEKGLFINLNLSDSESSNNLSVKSDISSSNESNNGSVNIRQIKVEPYIIRTRNK